MLNSNLGGRTRLCAALAATTFLRNDVKGVVLG